MVLTYFSCHFSLVSIFCVYFTVVKDVGIYLGVDGDRTFDVSRQHTSLNYIIAYGNFLLGCCRAYFLKMSCLISTVHLEGQIANKA